ncbi:uncharacterized protein [Antedon mediterranea]|uniref:uncharacterized protein n=1 Tax=Antedon mediterranea TaxID=105859 RepID=UPI003AF4A5A9
MSDGDQKEDNIKQDNVEAVDDAAAAEETQKEDPGEEGEAGAVTGRNTRPRPRSTKTTEIKKKKKAKWKPTHPNSTLMCVEAIESLKESKGSSGMAIKKYILSTYETVRPDMVNYMVRTALTKGLQTGVFVRPKGDESGGAHGRFKVGKKPDASTTSYKPTSRQKRLSPKKKGSNSTKKNDKKGKSKKSRKSGSKKRKKTRPSNKATLKVKASPKPKKAK